ncbi:enolase C-terminal domain-like protein, partial [Enterococcus gallinarum]|uniref:enolase C-terminal domain-like protein n=1 Tax=Enterococcus gallinarum TaxID=1353 RepID=UPI003D1256FF
AEVALDLKARGIGAVKTGGVRDPLAKVAAIREAVGPDMDIMADLHGPPWMTPKDAIVLGRALEPYNMLFLEDPVAPE